MAHIHTHDEYQHSSNQRRVFWAFLLTAGFMAAEVAGGLISGSLALLADAGHMLADAAALGLAWTAFLISKRPSDVKRSYGYHRFQVLAAFVNGLALAAIAAWIVFEAIGRLATPSPILGGVMLVVAVIGLAVNLAAFAVLHGGDRTNLNLRGALAHVAGDILGSIAAIVAAGVILTTGWTPIDPILSMLVALLIVRSAWKLIIQSAHILLEGTPDWLDVETLSAELVAEVPEVVDIHHVHAWSLDTDRPMLTLHATVRPEFDNHITLGRIKDVLKTRYGVTHSTIQIEPEHCVDTP